LITEHLGQCRKLPTVERMFRALPEPADHPTFLIRSTD
jgi:hypothetical protein